MNTDWIRIAATTLILFACSIFGGCEKPSQLSQKKKQDRHTTLKPAIADSATAKESKSSTKNSTASLDSETNSRLNNQKEKGADIAPKLEQFQGTIATIEDTITMRNEDGSEKVFQINEETQYVVDGAKVLLDALKQNQLVSITAVNKEGNMIATEVVAKSPQLEEPRKLKNQ